MTPFAGWIKPRGEPWRLACRAATWRACWDALLRVPCDAPLVERLVNDGRHPDARRRPR